MVFKINISEKSGKTFKIESESEELNGKSLHEKIDGNLISLDLAGWELEITGASDSAGFPLMENVEGVGLKKVLLKFEDKGMNKRPKHEGKRARTKNRPKGLRLRKTVRGKVISPSTVQINLKVVKEGNKKLSEVFPDQNKAPEPAPEVASAKTEQKPAETAHEQPAEKPAEIAK